jgi:multidrug efflux pump subunit AcrA (membrane-fusion protein)
MRVISKVQNCSNLFIVFSLLIGVLLFSNSACAATSEETHAVVTAVEGNIKLFVKEGQKVKKGKLLFVVDQLDTALAQNLEKARIEAKFDELTYMRKLKLSKSHNVSDQDLQDSLCAYEKALVQVKIYENNLEFNNYRAPYNCIVTKIMAVDGGGFGDGNPVLEIKKA